MLYCRPHLREYLPGWRSRAGTNYGDDVTKPETPQPIQSSFPPLEERINLLLSEPGMPSIACAESCTGGNVAARLTSISGSSAYFLGGIVSYSNSAKHALLDVPDEILESVGAVSAECALAMAEGARHVFDADITVSTTGIAGPTGATERKPVGLVYIAISIQGAHQVEEHRFLGDRAAITAAATERALEVLFDGIGQLIHNTTSD
jgi:PncC family amidohydrolase